MSPWKLHPFDAFGCLFRTVFPSYYQSRHSSVEAFLRDSSVRHAKLSITASTSNSNVPLVHVPCSCALWMSILGTNLNQTEKVPCPLTSLVFPGSSLNTRLSQEPCCQVEAHSIFWRAAALLRASRGKSYPVILALISFAFLADSKCFPTLHSFLG